MNLSKFWDFREKKQEEKARSAAEAGRDREYQFYDEVGKWVCECGARCDPRRGDWRWNGKEWEHLHAEPHWHAAKRKSDK